MRAQGCPIEVTLFYNVFLFFFIKCTSHTDTHTIFRYRYIQGHTGFFVCIFKRTSHTDTHTIFRHTDISEGRTPISLSVWLCVCYI